MSGYVSFPHDADAGTVLQCSKVYPAGIASMFALVNQARTRVEKWLCSCSYRIFSFPSSVEPGSGFSMHPCALYGNIVSKQTIAQGQCRMHMSRHACALFVLEDIPSDLQARCSRIELPAVPYGRQGPWAIKLWFKPSNQSDYQFQYLFSHNSIGFSDYAGHQYRYGHTVYLSNLTPCLAFSLETELEMASAAAACM